MSDVESMLLPICVPANAPAIHAIFRRLQGRIAELEAECDGYMKNAAFFRSCALSGESPTDGSEPYSPPIDTGSEG